MRLESGYRLIGRFYAEAYGMNVLVTRMFTHTGPRRGDVFAESSFAKQIALIEAGKQKPQIHVGNPDSMRTWADVRVLLQPIICWLPKTLYRENVTT